MRKLRESVMWYWSQCAVFTWNLNFIFPIVDCKHILSIEKELKRRKLFIFYLFFLYNQRIFIKIELWNHYTVIPSRKSLFLHQNIFKKRRGVSPFNKNYRKCQCWFFITTPLPKRHLHVFRSMVGLKIN